MGYSIPIYIFALAFSVFSCGSTNKKTTTHSVSDSTQIQPTKNDTLPDLPPPPQPGPAPGTIHLQGKVVGMDHTNNDSLKIYDFKVVKVLGIGAATPSVVQNDTLQIESSVQTRAIEKNMRLECIIRHQQKFAHQNDSSASWQLLEWK